MQESIVALGGAAFLYESDMELRSESITPDGRYLYLDRDNDGNIDFARLELDGGTELEEIIVTADDEGGAVVSPDGRWIAEHATSKSHLDVFVASLEGGLRKMLPWRPPLSRWPPPKIPGEV